VLERGSEAADGRAPRPPIEGHTLRVQGIPLDWDSKHLTSFLAQQDGFGIPNIRSLAPELHGRSQTATVAYENLPSSPQKRDLVRPLRLLAPTDQHSGSCQPSLALDDSFLGMTTLYVPRSEDHKVE